MPKQKERPESVCKFMLQVEGETRRSSEHVRAQRGPLPSNGELRKAISLRATTTGWGDGEYWESLHIKSGTTRRSFMTVAERSQVSPQLEIAASRKGRGGRRNCQALRGTETDGERRRTNFEFQLPPPSFPPSHSSTFLPSRHHIRAAKLIMLNRLDGPEIHGHTPRIKAHIWGVEH